MNKKECFQRLWNNTEDGWPDPDPNIKILVETRIGNVVITNGEILCRQMREYDNLLKTARRISDGHHCKRWMIIHL